MSGSGGATSRGGREARGKVAKYILADYQGCLTWCSGLNVEDTFIAWKDWILNKLLYI